MTEEEIQKNAIEFAKRNRNRIAKELTDTELFLQSSVPISIFMAGSPGAGKTEFSKNLIPLIQDVSDKTNGVIRIDPDEIRNQFSEYTGKNSYLFQSAVISIVEKVHDLALKGKQNFILDGTFSKYDKAVSNIKRSLKRSRPVFVFYVFQQPEIAWKFTQIREEVEGRHMPKSIFIEQFLGARYVVDRVVTEFKNQELVSVYLVKKDFNSNVVEKVVKIEGGNSIDELLPIKYSKEDLEKIII